MNTAYIQNRIIPEMILYILVRCVHLLRKNKTGESAASANGYFPIDVFTDTMNLRPPETDSSGSDASSAEVSDV